MRSILVRMPVTCSPSCTTATLSSLKMSRSRAMGVSRRDHALQRLHQRLHHLGEPVLPLDEEVEQVVLVDHADGAPVVVDHRHLRDVVLLELLDHRLDLVGAPGGDDGAAAAAQHVLDGGAGHRVAARRPGSRCRASTRRRRTWRCRRGRRRAAAPRSPCPAPARGPAARPRGPPRRSEPPAKIPSSRASRRAMAKAWASFTWRTSSSTARSMAPHIMSSPMPSTL